jgi:carbohydrate kinase (thermoresistant glucokinase family)
MVVILMGPTGCGKTTIGRMLAGRLGWAFYDADDFHPRKNVDKMRAGIPLTDTDRQPWLKRLHSEIQGWLSRRLGAVLACSALKQVYRDRLGVDQAAVVTVYLKGNYELIRKRIGARRHRYMPPGLLRSQFEALEEPADGLSVDITPAPGIIVQTIIETLNLEPRTPGPATRDTS